MAKVRGLRVQFGQELALARVFRCDSRKAYAEHIAQRLGEGDARMGLELPPMFECFPELKAAWTQGANEFLLN